MSRLYNDFGNVFVTDFRTWWQEDRRGERLFAEPPAPLWLHELNSSSDWDANWDRDSVMIVAVPLNETKQHLMTKFSNLLARRKVKVVGVKNRRKGAATYRVNPKFSIDALGNMIDVYELHKNYKASGKKITLAELGNKARIAIEYGEKSASDEIIDEEKRRNVMASTVSRYLKKAKILIANIGIGKFPCFD